MGLGLLLHPVNIKRIKDSTAIEHFVVEIGVSVDESFTNNTEANYETSLEKSNISMRENSEEEKSIINEAFTKMLDIVSETFEEEIEENKDISTPIISKGKATFELPSSTVPTYLNIHFICEAASRLLFLSVQWANKLPVIASLK